MYYVVGTKIYLDTKDTKTNSYLECHLKKVGVDTYRVVVTGKGLAEKPQHRQVCTFNELVAQLGQLPSPVPVNPEGSSKEDAK